MKLLLIFLSTVAFTIAQEEFFNRLPFYYHLFNSYIEPSFADQSWGRTEDWRSDEDSFRASSYSRKGSVDVPEIAPRYINGNRLLKTLFLYTTLTRTVTSATSCIPLTLFNTDAAKNLCRRKRRELVKQVLEKIDGDLQPSSLTAIT